MSSVMKTVNIDGVDFVRRDTVVSDKTMRLLLSMWTILMAEAWYDPTNETTRNFAEPLWEMIKEVNSELRFKR